MFMRFHYIIFLSLIICHTSTAEVFYYISSESVRDASISSPEECSSSIGAGGNLIENGKTFAGKCEGAGLAPKISGPRDLAKYIQFTNDSNYSGGSTTRSELAITSEYFPFNEVLYVGFNLMIPANVDYTDEFFYLMQLWQCSPASPIAGIRLSRGAGNSHTINFMTRGDYREGSFATHHLAPGAWHSVILQYTVNPRNGDGKVALWLDHNGTPIVENTSYGFFNVGVCSPRVRPPQHFRIKFGMYKGDEPGRKFDVRIDNFRVGNTYNSVKPQ